MGDFFHGWRRKLGVVALLMACLITTAWVRSLRVEDRLVFFSAKNALQSLHAWNGAVSWTSFYGKTESDSVVLTKAFRNWSTFPAFTGLVRYERYFLWLGVFPACEVSSAGMQGAMCLVSYWSIVVPLMLLSGYLLICQPQPRRPTLSEPGDQ